MGNIQFRAFYCVNGTKFSMKEWQLDDNGDLLMYVLGDFSYQTNMEEDERRIRFLFRYSRKNGLLVEEMKYNPNVLWIKHQEEEIKRVAVKAFKQSLAEKQLKKIQLKKIFDKRK